MTCDTRIRVLTRVASAPMNPLIATLGLAALLLTARGDLASLGRVADPEGGHGQPKNTQGTPDTGGGLNNDVCVPKSYPGIDLLKK
jgi:hypothetical protein